jgi:hypothetical protein
MSRMGAGEAWGLQLRLLQERCPAHTLEVVEGDGWDMAVKMPILMSE